MTVTQFEDLEIWQNSRILCKTVKGLTCKTPFFNDFKLRDQIRSSSGSVMDNIAEGFERDGNKEFVQFLTIAKGSNGETRSQAYRAFDYDYITNEELEDIVYQTKTLGKKIGSFINYLKNSEFKGNKFK